MSPQNPTNVMIMNPYFSLKGGELDVRLHEKSFQQAMDFVKKNKSRVRHVFMMADVPPFTSRAGGIFRTKADARNRRGKFGFRHLGQFHSEIIEGYRPMMGELIPENIQILTESRARQMIRDLPSEKRDKMAKCEQDGTVSCVIGHVSCRAITCISMNTCLEADGVNQLEYFVEGEGDRVNIITMLDAAMDVSRIFGHQTEQLNINICK